MRYLIHRYIRRYNRLLPISSIFILISIIIWCESIELELISLTREWHIPKTSRQDGHVIRILLVADPQLIGYDHEQLSSIGLLTRWDSDR
jgi:hypothetical protein